ERQEKINVISGVNSLGTDGARLCPPSRVHFLFELLDQAVRHERSLMPAFANGLTTSRTCWRKLCTTGLTVLFLSVTIHTGHGLMARSTGRTLTGNRSALNCSTEPTSAEMKRSVASNIIR